jgi:hypothetical protein
VSTRRKVHEWKIGEGLEGVTRWIDPTGAATAVLLGIPRPASMAGAIHVTGEGGGKLIFRPDGRVLAVWNEVAAIASAHGSGNRGVRITDAAGNRECPVYSETFDAVALVRRVGRQGFDFPEDHEGPEVLKRLELFQKLAWRMLRDVGTGNAADLRAIADALEAADKLHSGELETPLEKWCDYAAAIAQAAEEANGIPKKHEVKKALEKALPKDRQKWDYREDLARMGFGWLPAPSGRPPKGEG